jgi:hypothetical protein
VFNPFRWLFSRAKGVPDFPPGRVSIVDISDTGEIIMGPVDMLGQEIKLLSRIAYPAAYLRNKVQMAVATVTEFTPDGGLVVKVELRSREASVRREIVHLSATGLGNVVVIG